MNCPPTKRLRGLNQDIVTAMAFDDPFGDDEEFTQDDLDEIDIIASQAFTSGAGGAGIGSKPGTKPNQALPGPSSAGQNKPLYRANHSKESTDGFNRGNALKPSRDPLGNMQQQSESGREESYRLLEVQHAELKRKLKEVEEEILLKNGEIRVLRDSLKTAQQQKDAQRQNQILLETERQKEQSDKEKELNKKVQSLQSELQFKEAEINEMKTKLHSSDKNRTASPLQRNSPKVIGTLAQMHHGSSSSSSASPIGNGFITKEVFGAQLSSRTTPGKTPVKMRKDDRGSSLRCEASRPDPFLSVKPLHLHHRGGVLLGLLLQQPLFPSCLGISHLLSMNQTVFSQLSAGFQHHSDPVTAPCADEAGGPRGALSEVQTLAVTGLNMLSRSQPATAASSSKSRLCPGAILLLPLLDLHLSHLCKALDSLRSSTGSSGSDLSTTSSLKVGQSVSVSMGLGKHEETGLSGFTMEDIGLASLRLLYHLIVYSDEVVEAVVLKEKHSTDIKSDHCTACLDVSSQNTLLQSILRLCDTCLVGSGFQREELAVNTLKTLCVLIERLPHTHSERLQCVLQVVCRCLSADSTLQTVSECVCVLMLMSDHETLAKQLFSQHDPCVFLKLFQLIRTRPDNQTMHTDWILLNLQVVRLLNRLTQRTETWMTTVQSTCQCYTELVQTIVIIFHRQWLDLSGFQEPTDSTGSSSQPCSTSCSPWWCSPAASLLRECLLLLHWMLLHHGSFSESCRPLLHMYDQMIPAVRDTLRKIPDLSESEEFALEEICRSEGDDTDDMDTDTGS